MKSTKKISPEGTDWKDFEKENFTPEEIEASNKRVAIIGKFIKMRDEMRREYERYL